MKIFQDLIHIGINDKKVDLFEGQFVVPNGISYNSFVIKDDKTAVISTADEHFSKEWLDEVKSALGNKTPDYLIILHMEPDHSASIDDFLRAYPQTQIVGNNKIFVMLEEYFGAGFGKNRVEVKDGDELSLGKHVLKFVFAPLVHWPEVMVAYDVYDKTLYSADGFGKFGALDCNEEWDSEARRYYFGIVGKFGAQVQSLLKKLAPYELSRICPLHGPVLEGDLAHYLKLYDTWSLYKPEKEGVVIAYTSIYGHTKKAVTELENKLKDRGAEVTVLDLARVDRPECIAQAFRYSTLVLATTTYN
ncbi:MAG: MBL fold metallo-hydrolase, partial [Clostridia bacterium]|nr:MBL fold metallo-hydrolase [Clostridia bacterium]